MVDILINIHKIKFAILDEIVTFDADSDTVNFYIDMHTIVSKFYKKNNGPDIINYNRSTYNALMSATFNLIAHYRRYFHKHGKSNRIFLIMDRHVPDYQSRQIPFAHDYFDRYSDKNVAMSDINRIMEDLYVSLRSLVRYFKGVYFIETENIDDVTKIQYLIESYAGQNIIYTKYDYYYQLVSNPKTSIIFPKRDASYIIDRESVFSALLDKLKYRPTHLDYRILPIYFMIEGVKCRDVPSMNVKGKVKMMKLLDVMIEDGYITNDVSVQSFLKYFSPLIQSTANNDATLVKRYQAMNAKLNVKALTKSQINQIEHSIVDLYDENSIEKINDTLDTEYQVNYLDLYKSDASIKLTKRRWNG